MRGLTTLVFILFLATSSRIAIGQDESTVTIHTTETLITEYVGDNGDVNEGIYGDDDDFWTLRNLLNFQARSPDFDGGLRIDTTLFFNPPQEVDAELFQWGPGSDDYTLLDYHNDFRVERIYGIVKLGRFQFTGGDFHVTFGRGMALSLVKLDDVGLDNALRGARFEYRIPRKFKVELLGGVVNALNVDPMTRQIQKDDPLDRILGARIELEPGDAVVLGLHGVVLRPRFQHEWEIEPDRMYIDRGTGVAANNVGGSINLRVSDLSIYLEANAQTHDNYRPPEGVEDVIGEPGFAAFSEVIYDLTPFTLKGEGLFYKKWLMDGPLRGSATNIVATQPISYQHMVTLEPTWMPIKSVGNAAGGQLTGDVFISKTKTEISLAGRLIKYYGGLLPQGDWNDHGNTLILHPELVFRQLIGEHQFRVTTKGGYRHEWETVDERREGDLWHVLLDLSVPLTGPHSISLISEVRRHMLTVTEGGEPYWITLNTLGYNRSGLYGISILHEYSDQVVVPSTPEMWGFQLPIPEHHFLSLIANFQPPKPLDGLTVRFLIGTQRGGHKCAGGVCRDYPNSAGAKLEAVYRF